MEDCIFCKIVNKEVPSENDSRRGLRPLLHLRPLRADLVYEDEKIIAFKDIEPKSPVHILIVPKKHIFSVNQLETEDKELIGELFLIAQKIAREQKISETGYRLSVATGRDAGQTVNHLHLHLMGGAKLPFA